MGKPKISVCLPSYNGEAVIGETIKSILEQKFSDFEVVVNDDNSGDGTIGEVKRFKDKRIKVFRNKKRLGYAKNLREAFLKTKGEVVFLMGQDDILAKGVFGKVKEVFEKREIGALTRGYYWFYKDEDRAVRIKRPVCLKEDVVINKDSSLKDIKTMFETVDQLSGLAFRRSLLNDSYFGKEVFTAHVYPVAYIFKKYSVMAVKNFWVKVRIETSQTRKEKEVYGKSPIESWVEMFEKVYKEKEFEKMRKFLIKDFAAKNYVGLVQIKNYGSFNYLIREIGKLIKYRWENIFNPLFWFWMMVTILVPRKILRALVDWYKGRVNYVRFRKVKAG